MQIDSDDVRNSSVTILGSLSDELAPRADLGRHPPFGILFQTALGYLFCQALYEELCAAGVVQQRKAEVDGISRHEG